ncbi:MAG: hypothetical protein NHG36_09345, partial [Chromatiaceae bacterium]|nr:hypothetical protein [Candidatus Thioaporhodococcus sediminis]
MNKYFELCVQILIDMLVFMAMYSVLSMVLVGFWLTVARARGDEIDAKELGRALGVPVVPMVANRGLGVGELKA